MTNKSFLHSKTRSGKVPKEINCEAFVVGTEKEKNYNSNNEGENYLQFQCEAKKVPFNSTLSS